LRFSGFGFSGSRLAFLFALLLVSAATAAASTTTLQAVSDTYISSGNPSTNFGSQTTMLVGGGNSALVQFDLSSFSAVPPASVSSATFSFWITGITTGGEADMFALSSAWSESTVTFVSQPATGPLQAAGLPTLDPGIYITVDITTLFKSWLFSPATNFGLEIRASVAAPPTVITLASRENSAVNEPPILTVTTVSATPEPGTFALFGTGLVGLIRVLRRRRAT
jgi:hypothetical protein